MSETFFSTFDHTIGKQATHLTALPNTINLATHNGKELNFTPRGPCQLCNRCGFDKRIFIPKAFNYVTETWTLTGNFCWFNCVMRYLVENPTYNLGTQLMLLPKMAKEIYKYTGDISPIAPSCTHIRNGGLFDVEDYYKKIFSTKTPVHLTLVHEVPFITHAMMMECQLPEMIEDDGGKITSTNKTKIWNVRGLRIPKSIANESVTTTKPSASSSIDPPNLNSSTLSEHPSSKIAIFDLYKSGTTDDIPTTDEEDELERKTKDRLNQLKKTGIQKKKKSKKHNLPSSVTTTPSSFSIEEKQQNDGINKFLSK